MPVYQGFRSLYGKQAPAITGIIESETIGMQPVKNLLSVPLAPRLLSGWLVLSLVVFGAAFRFAGEQQSNVERALLMAGEQFHAEVRAFVHRQESATASLAADPELRTLVRERRANCTGDCLSANSFRIAERLGDATSSFPGESRLFVWVDNQAIGDKRSELPPALASELSSTSAGWLRPVPPPTTLSSPSPIREVPVYFFAALGSDAFLVMELDAYVASDLMISGMSNAGYPEDRYLFDNRGVLLSRPRYTDTLVSGGVLRDPWPILNVSLRDPGMALETAEAPGERSSQPLIAPVAAAMNQGDGQAFEPFRNYVGEPSLATFWFDKALGIGGVVSVPARQVSAQVRNIWIAATLISVAAAVWLALIGRSIVQREQKVAARLDRSREELERADSALDEARDEIEDEVSRRKQAFDEYARTEQSLAALLQAFPHGVLMFDAAGKLLMVNRQFRMQWGVPAGESTEEAVFGAMATQLGRQLDDLEDVLMNDDAPAYLSLENGRQMVVESWPASVEADKGGRFLVFRESSEDNARPDGEAESNPDSLGAMLLSQLNLPVALVARNGEIRLTTPAFDAYCDNSMAHIHDRVHPASDCPGGDACSLLTDAFDVEPLDDGELYRESFAGDYLIGIVPTVELFVESKHRRRPGMLNPAHVAWHLQKLWCLQILSRSTNHDFNNRISAIYGYSDLVEMTPGDADALGESVEEIRKAAEQGQVLVQSYMGFARSLVGERADVNAGELLDRAMQLGLLIKPFSIEVETERSDNGVEIRTHENLAMQVLVAVMLDLVSDLEPVGGTLTVRLGNDSEKGLAISIEGRAATEMSVPRWRRPERAFNQRTCASILDYLGGSWQVTERADGARFDIYLPGEASPGDVILLVGGAGWADVLGENLERNGRAALAVDDLETAQSVFENQPQMFGGVVIEGASDEAIQAFSRVASAISPAVNVVPSDDRDTATDVLSRLF